MKLKITVDGKTYEVEVEASEPEPQRGPLSVTPAQARVLYPPPAPRPPANGAGGADEGKVCRSPIAGTVVRIAARPGQAMQVGDVLLVLEAMKMETNITAPVAATVAKVNATVGEPVQTGQILVEFS